MVTLERARQLTTWLSDGFFLVFAQAAARHGLDPVDLARVLYGESHFKPDAFNRDGNGNVFAQGIFQAIPSSLKAIGYTRDKAYDTFRNLSAEEQAFWLDKYLDANPAARHIPSGRSELIHWAFFYPATMHRGSQPTTVIVSRDADSAGERAAYNANSVFDKDHKGYITVADMAAYDARTTTSELFDAFVVRMRDALSGGSPPGSSSPGDDNGPVASLATPVGLGTTPVASASAAPLLVGGLFGALAWGVLSGTMRRRISAVL